ncbi:MAG: hypothetical protein RBR52_10745 [Thiomonas sp.]|uniref:hypothetical protein n=1 Tax=Thiomonas sp. TaxID=2047785 RepID=UPI002A36459E|nr:hypothetical protein [Thiomonas sp.]MDY0330962.1 hypothetical protein [Thiomonas sp.]
MLPESLRHMRNWNRDCLDFAQQQGWRSRNTPIIIALYSDVLQSFRLTARGQRPGWQPPPQNRYDQAAL